MKFALKDAKLWRYPGKAGWYFVNADTDVSKLIQDLTKGDKRGWGSVPVLVRVGTVEWRTSIFPDKAGYYLLPVKADVRKALGWDADDVRRVEIELLG